MAFVSTYPRPSTNRPLVLHDAWAVGYDPSAPFHGDSARIRGASHRGWRQNPFLHDRAAPTPDQAAPGADAMLTAPFMR